MLSSLILLRLKCLLIFCVFEFSIVFEFLCNGEVELDHGVLLDINYVFVSMATSMIHMHSEEALNIVYISLNTKSTHVYKAIRD